MLLDPADSGDRQAAVDARAIEQAKRFVVLDRDLSQEAGELTPTLKVKRDVVNRNYAEKLEALYA